MQCFDVTFSHTVLLPDIAPARSTSEEHDHSVILFGEHQYSGGTHAPYPRQQLRKEYELEAMNHGSLFGFCRVIDASLVEGEIARNHLEEFGIGQQGRVLLKTAYTNPPGGEFVPVTEDAVTFLASSGVSLFGIDAPVSREYAHVAQKTHRSLRHRGISILEGLNLEDIEPGDYFITALPEKALFEEGGVPVKVTLLAI